MSNVRFLDKRTWDNRLFDIDCSDLVAGSEAIVSATIACDQGGLVFGTPVINASPLSYPLYGRSPAIGKVVQVQISGGVIPPGASELMCTLRLRMVTNINPALEATVLLRLIDTAP